LKKTWIEEMTDKPLEQILEEFMQRCEEEKRKKESVNFKEALENLKKQGNDLKRVGESLISSRKQPAPPELKQIYFILDINSPAKYLGREEHHEIRDLVRTLISKYPGFIEQHGQELDRRLVKRAKKDFNLINEEMDAVYTKAKHYQSQALEKNKRTKKIRDAVESLQAEFRQVYLNFQDESARCNAELNRGRRCSLRKLKSLDAKTQCLDNEIKSYQRKAEQVHRETVELKLASDCFTAEKEVEIGKRFILTKLNTDFLMGKSYKKRIEYLAQTEND